MSATLLQTLLSADVFGSKTQPCEDLQVLVMETGTAIAKDVKKTDVTENKWAFLLF